MLDDALVLGRAAGLGAGVGDQRAVLGDARVLLVANGVLVERARREVAVHVGDGDAVGGEVEGGGRGAHRLLRFPIRRMYQPRQRGRTKILMEPKQRRKHNDARPNE